MSGDEGEPFIRSRPASPTASLILENSQDGRNDDDSAIWSPVQASGRLYVSHTLSTANSRVFEFGSVLYIAAVFPNTLMPMSVYAMARGASAVAFSSLVGRYIDTENRLRVVRMSIGRLAPAGCTMR
jgi:hypothetical protein